MASSHLRVLVVDDDNAIRELVAEYLRGRGMEVEAFAGGAAACASIDAHPPDAVVVDLRLPDMDGVEIVRLACQCSPPVPVVVTTGYGTVESAIASLKTGASDFILKPFRLREVHASVERAMERARRQRQADIDLATLGLFQRAEMASSPDEAEALVAALMETLGRMPGVLAELGGPDAPGLPLGGHHRIVVEPVPEPAMALILAVHRALLRSCP